MSISILEALFNDAFFHNILLFSTNAIAQTINGTASVLDFEKTKGQPKRCIKLPSVLDATQLYYGDFMRLEGGPKGNPETSFQAQPWPSPQAVKRCALTN